MSATLPQNASGIRVAGRTVTKLTTARREVLGYDPGTGVLTWKVSRPGVKSRRGRGEHTRAVVPPVASAGSEE